MSDYSDVEQVKNIVVRTVKRVLESHHSKLGNVLHGSLSDFSGKMLERSLISQPVMDSGSFDQIMQQFQSGLPYSEDLPALEGQCKSFLTVLEELSGPPAKAARKLMDELRSEVEKAMPDLAFLPHPKYNKSSSTPVNVVSIKPKFNRHAYSEDHPHQTSMEGMHRFKSNNGQFEGVQDALSDTSFVTRPTDQSAIYFQAKEEERDGGNGPDVASEFAPAIRPKSLQVDPRNPVISGKKPSGSVKSPVSPHQASNDSGLPLTKTNSPELAVRSESQQTSDSLQASQPISDPNGTQQRRVIGYTQTCASCTELLSYQKNEFQRVQMPNLSLEFIEHLKEQRTLQERERKENEKLLRETFTLEISQLRQENQRLRKEWDTERERLYEEKTELKQEKSSLKSFEDTLLKTKKDLETWQTSLENKAKAHMSSMQIEKDRLLKQKRELVEKESQVDEQLRIMNGKQKVLDNREERLKMDRYELKNEKTSFDKEKCQFQKDVDHLKEKEYNLEVKFEEVVKREEEVAKMEQKKDKLLHEIRELDKSIKERQSGIVEEEKCMQEKKLEWLDFERKEKNILWEKQQKLQARQNDIRMSEKMLRQTQKKLTNMEKKHEEKQRLLKGNHHQQILGFILFNLIIVPFMSFYLYSIYF